MSSYGNLPCGVPMSCIKQVNKLRKEERVFKRLSTIAIQKGIPDTNSELERARQLVQTLESRKADLVSHRDLPLF